jgi:SpoVK/Ycf46/Vps4 family AAA+-type ATPase
LGLPADKPRPDLLLPYRADCVNTDGDLTEVAAALTASPSARLCLYGPPGTGKTQWARELAERLARPLLVRRASDLLDKYVGGTEARIRAAFEQAQAEGAILLIDEADSFLQARDGSRAHWETSMVNEMLTAMEAFDGIFVASTNLQDRLDAASARRFDFKVKFSPLDAAQARQLFADLLNLVGLPPNADTPTALSFDALAGTTPGDFANVARQVRLAPSKRNPHSLFQLLVKELQFREAPQGSSRRIGFV